MDDRDIAQRVVNRVASQTVPSSSDFKYMKQFLGNLGAQVDHLWKPDAPLQHADTKKILAEVQKHHAAAAKSLEAAIEAIEAGMLKLTGQDDWDDWHRDALREAMILNGAGKELNALLKVCKRGDNLENALDALVKVENQVDRLVGSDRSKTVDDKLEVLKKLLFDGDMAKAATTMKVFSILPSR